MAFLGDKVHASSSTSTWVLFWCTRPVALGLILDEESAENCYLFFATKARLIDFLWKWDSLVIELSLLFPWGIGFSFVPLILVIIIDYLHTWKLEETLSISPKCRRFYYVLFYVVWQFLPSRRMKKLGKSTILILLSFEFTRARANHVVLLCQQQMSTNHVDGRWRFLLIENILA